MKKMMKITKAIFQAALVTTLFLPVTKTIAKDAVENVLLNGNHNECKKMNTLFIISIDQINRL